MNNRSDFLFATPSFLRGISRILDIGGVSNRYNNSNTTVEADLKALRSDWNLIGEDIRESMNEYRKENKDKFKSITR